MRPRKKVLAFLQSKHIIVSGWYNTTQKHGVIMSVAKCVLYSFCIAVVFICGSAHYMYMISLKHQNDNRCYSMFWLSSLYSGTCTIQRLSFPTSCDIRQKIYGPKVFLLTKIKPEYSDILYNPTHFPGPLQCRIRQVPLYI